MNTNREYDMLIKIALTPEQRAMRRQVGTWGQGSIVSRSSSMTGDIAALEAAQAARVRTPKPSGPGAQIVAPAAPKAQVVNPSAATPKPLPKTVSNAAAARRGIGSRLKSFAGRAARGFGRLSRFGKAGVIGAGAAALGAGFLAGRSGGQSRPGGYSGGYKYANLNNSEDTMNKQAVLEQIQQESFKDEFQKVAIGRLGKSIIGLSAVGSIAVGSKLLKDKLYGKGREAIIHPKTYTGKKGDTRVSIVNPDLFKKTSTGKGKESGKEHFARKLKQAVDHIQSGDMLHGLNEASKIKNPKERHQAKMMALMTGV